ncbi:MAG: serine/threonine-protein kinase [Polyangiaceae bacterium]
MTSLQAGTVFAGRYRVVQPLARGSMGVVYEALHTQTDRRVALKIMLSHEDSTPELRDRFQREARVAAQVGSDHIVDVIDAGCDDATGLPFMVMELLQGEELRARIDRGPLPAAEALLYLAQIAAALDKTHAANIVHRDLKPANLYLARRTDGSVMVKILDFGVAKFLERRGVSPRAATQATQTLGTPIYMSPEQFHGDAVSSQTDNFALAMVAFAMLVGHPYWAEEAEGAVDFIDFATAVASGPVEPATRRAARRGVNLPPAFDAWFAKATARERGLRFAQASMMIRALGAALTPPAAKTEEMRKFELPPHIARRAGMSVTDRGTVRMEDDTATCELPAPRTPPAVAAKLRLEDYARLVARLEGTAPDAIDAVLAEFRMGRQDYSVVSAAWAAEFAKDPALTQRFQHVLASARARR